MIAHHSKEAPSQHQTTGEESNGGKSPLALPQAHSGREREATLDETSRGDGDNKYNATIVSTRHSKDTPTQHLAAGEVNN